MLSLSFLALAVLCASAYGLLRDPLFGLLGGVLVLLAGAAVGCQLRQEVVYRPLEAGAGTAP